MEYTSYSSPKTRILFQLRDIIRNIYSLHIFGHHLPPSHFIITLFTAKDKILYRHSYWLLRPTKGIKAFTLSSWMTPHFIGGSVCYGRRNMAMVYKSIFNSSSILISCYSSARYCKYPTIVTVLPLSHTFLLNPSLSPRCMQLENLRNPIPKGVRKDKPRMYKENEQDSRKVKICVNVRVNLAPFSKRRKKQGSIRG